MKQDDQKPANKDISFSNYPVQQRFTSKEEMNKYLQSDKLTCLFCGRKYHDLAAHLRKSHDASPKAYCRNYGLPESCDLVSKHMQQKRLEKSKQLKSKQKSAVQNHSFVAQQNSSFESCSSYPWTGSFKTKAEIERYFSHDRIICLLCGKRFFALVTHLKKLHNLSTDEYRKLYGLPWTRGLVGQSLRRRKQEIAREFRAIGKLNTQCPDIESFKQSTRSRYKKIHPYEAGKVRKYTPKDFDTILDLTAQGKTPKEIFISPNVPSRIRWNRYRQQNPQYDQRFLDLMDSMPFRFQAQCESLGKRFEDAIVPLIEKGVSQKDIATQLDVSQSAVSFAFRRLQDKGLAPDLQKKTKWKAQDYDEILKRVQQEKRTPKDVCSDVDIPSYGSWRSYRKAHPNYQTQYEKMMESLPFSLQSQSHALGKRFKEAVLNLHQQGFSQKRIAQELGVSRSSVYSALEHIPQTHVLKKAISAPIKPIVKNTKSSQKPLPGYPWRKAFTTPEEVDEYFDHDRIVCLLCGHRFQSVSSHLRHSHTMNVEQYKETYGFPRGKGLIGKTFLSFRKKQAKELQERGLLLKGDVANFQPSAISQNSLPEYAKEKLRRQAKSRMWSGADFEDILTRIKEECLTPAAICKEPNRPSYQAWIKYRQLHPEFDQRFKQAMELMPFAFQAKCNALGDRYRRSMLQLHKEGLRIPEIAQKLGVSVSTVYLHIKYGFPEGHEFHRSRSRWSRNDYENILSRIHKGESPREICSDPNAPSYANWLNYRNRHPEYNKRFETLMESMPFHLQAKSHRLGDRFKEEVLRLNRQGFSQEQIGKNLGVSAGPVQRILSKIN